MGLKSITECRMMKLAAACEAVSKQTEKKKKDEEREGARSSYTAARAE
jgi:hypothetical protein